MIDAVMKAMFESIYFRLTEDTLPLRDIEHFPTGLIPIIVRFRTFFLPI
jgi:hypothetical protein